MENHRQRDLGIAAFLIVHGFRLLGVEPSGNRFDFLFEDPSGNAQQTALSYLQGEPCSALAFMDATKLLKTLLYSRKGYGNDRQTHRR